MATGWPMKTTYANGDVFSASDVNDITGTINLLQTSTLSNQAGKNPFINGSMSVWQRGTSFAFNNESKYTADRMYPTIVNTGATVSRQTTSDTTNLPFIQYCMRLQRNNATTNTGSIALTSSLENVDSQRFIGQTVTLSFYARRGSNYSSSSNVLTYYLVSGTGTDQNQATGFTGQATPIASTATLTTTWQKFSATATVSASATQLAFNCFYSPTGTAGAADYFEITGLQLELGSYATSFSRAGGTIQGELAACQRYYYRTANTSTGATHAVGTGYSTTAVLALMNLPVSMRVAPTVIEYANQSVDTGSGGSTFTSMTINQSSSGSVLLYVTGATGLTQYRPYFINNNANAAGYIGLGAEL